MTAIPARVVITDALASAYGTDGEPAQDYWGDGADLIITSLIDAGWLPPEADPVENGSTSEAKS